MAAALLFNKSFELHIDVDDADVKEVALQVQLFLLLTATSNCDLIRGVVFLPRLTHISVINEMR